MFRKINKYFEKRRQLRIDKAYARGFCWAMEMVLLNYMPLETLESIIDEKTVNNGYTPFERGAQHAWRELYICRKNRINLTN